MASIPSGVGFQLSKRESSTDTASIVIIAVVVPTVVLSLVCLRTVGGGGVASFKKPHDLLAYLHR